MAGLFARTHQVDSRMKKPEDAWGRQMLAQYHSQNVTVEIIERDDGYIAMGSDPGLYFREFKAWPIGESFRFRSSKPLKSESTVMAFEITPQLGEQVYIQHEFRGSHQHVFAMAVSNQALYLSAQNSQ